MEVGFIDVLFRLYSDRDTCGSGTGEDPIFYGYKTEILYVQIERLLHPAAVMAEYRQNGVCNHTCRTDTTTYKYVYL